ncbi:MAG TPA: helix-turn-helix domain-containing protein [Caulobacteraceae bacterium]|nr:helix-turn-helix domain-containing protein [Caulobacteraceae bacterium]
MTQPSDQVSQEDFEALAAFRMEIRRYLAFAHDAAESCGITMQQHQAMLAVRASSEQSLTVGELAEALFLRHHSAVELTNRLVKSGLVERRKDLRDARKAVVVLTLAGLSTLNALAASHVGELRGHAPTLVRALSRLTKPASAKRTG